jgi:hypothetical protein
MKMTATKTGLQSLWKQASLTIMIHATPPQHDLRHSTYTTLRFMTVCVPKIAA